MECHEWRISEVSIQRVIVAQFEVSLLAFKERRASCHRTDNNQAKPNTVNRI